MHTNFFRITYLFLFFLIGKERKVYEESTIIMIPTENRILKLKTVKYEINFFINYKYKFLNNLYLTYIIFDF